MDHLCACLVDAGSNGRFLGSVANPQMVPGCGTFQHGALSELGASADTHGFAEVKGMITMLEVDRRRDASETDRLHVVSEAVRPWRAVAREGASMASKRPRSVSPRVVRSLVPNCSYSWSALHGDEEPNMQAFTALSETFMDVVASNDALDVTVTPWKEIVLWMDDILTDVMGCVDETHPVMLLRGLLSV